MPNAHTASSARIHRVTTRRRNLQALRCPLEPELLVAEFAGELPPDVALAVREHIAVCETCGARSRALHAPYELLSSLGNKPVAYVPDLRDSVRSHLRSNRIARGLRRTISGLGRGGAIGFTSIIGLVAVVAFLVAGFLYTANAHNVPRSANTLSGVPAAATSGILFAETDKLITVRDSSGLSWQVAEVIAIDQRTGSVLHSLPVSSDSLQSANSNEAPVAVAVAPNGRMVYEVTALNSAHQQALIAFDASTGGIRYITLLKYPGGGVLTHGNQADALAVAPDGTILYVGLYEDHPENGGTRALAIDARSGVVERKLYPGSQIVVSMPPPPGSLPVSAFPSSVPKLNISSYAVSLGADGELAVSPDGQWLFDVLLLSNDQGVQYGVVRRFDTYTGYVQQELAIPGDFTLARLAATTPGELATAQAEATAAVGIQATATAEATASPNATPVATPITPIVPTSQLYLVKGSPAAECFVLDPGATGPTLTGNISLGGPSAPPGTAFSGTLTVSPSADGAHLYITQAVSAQRGLVTGQDLWDLDVQGMGVVSHRVDTDSADAVQAGAFPTSTAFILRGGSVLLINSDLSGTPVSWLSLNSGHVIAFLGATS